MLDNDIIQITNFSVERLSQVPWMNLIMFSETLTSFTHSIIKDKGWCQRFLIVYPCHGKGLMLLLGIILNSFIDNQVVLYTLVITSTTFLFIWQNFIIIQIIINSVWDNTSELFLDKWETWVSLMLPTWFPLFRPVTKLFYPLLTKLEVLLCFWSFRPFDVLDIYARM